MFRVGQKRSFSSPVIQKQFVKRRKYYGNKRFSGNKTFYGRRNRLLVGSNKRYLSSKSLKDEVFSPEHGILNRKIHPHYFTLPCLGQGVECRHTNRVKIWTINLEGRFTIRQFDNHLVVSHGDHTMVEDPSQPVDLNNIEGYMGLFVVLDRMPVPTAVPEFSDIFGQVSNTDASMLDLHVRVDQLSRFKVLIRERRYVNESLNGSIFTFKRYVKLNGRNSIMTTFKDMGSNTSGRYGNVRDNAILMYVVWDSVVVSLMRYSLNSRIMYFH
ncbi:hypothetical protein RHMOL_Rhmol08G0187800 [Rhododendron molle]|uniref:Uncharacterized protein n=1 Tax=Rhododendron molle TaxID=49168 RepID=A0ACC0MPU3_RHOML|nr:hypothetical protein RHMOL_Rhmol08G0187800 [Rhododendron molle]